MLCLDPSVKCSYSCLDVRTGTLGYTFIVGIIYKGAKLIRCNMCCMFVIGRQNGYQFHVQHAPLLNIP